MTDLRLLPRLSGALRALAGAAIVALLLAASVLAVFPRSRVGAVISDVLIAATGAVIASFIVSCVLHIGEQVVRSFLHWRNEKRPPGERFLLRDDCVELFRGWVERTGEILVALFLLGFWMGVVGFAAYLLSLGNLGFVPSWGNMP